MIGHRYGWISEGWSQASHIKRYWKSLRRPGCRHQGMNRKKALIFSPNLLKLLTNIYFCLIVLRLHARLSKNKWTDSTGTRSTALWVKDSLSRWQDRRTRVYTSIIQANLLFYSLNAERSINQSHIGWPPCDQNHAEWFLPWKNWLALEGASLEMNEIYTKTVSMFIRMTKTRL